ncbi:MAG: FtsW/RodA/SpoVE family cell cycle protein [Leptolyngbyaceae bacterium]|nr:FtsW/RodA/SpoVE family cell cycle protein [Leptolyngbyaceae bacterium]
MTLRYLAPLFNWSAGHWAWEARLLRWLTFVWLIVGLMILFSSSYPVAEKDFGDGLYYFKTQLMWIALGLFLLNFLVRIPIRYILAIADLFVIFFLGLIILTLVPGVGQEVNGATRWLVIGPVGIQPSELMKPFLVLQSARIFGRWSQLTPFTRWMWLGVFGLVLVCILIQPNLSTAALCGMVVWLVAFASGLPYRYVGGAAGAGLMLAMISINLQDYQRQRIITFLDPWSDQTGNGYQLVQSLLAVGSGGWWGAGFGMSQQKLFYLPIQYTDFIFAVFAEEFGFIGCVMLFILLAFYATLGLRVAVRAQKRIYQLVAIGAIALLVGQSLLNIGVATGALPTTGLPFPMMSYGGSSMLSSLITVGLLIRVARESNEAEVLTPPPSLAVRR